MSLLLPAVAAVGLAVYASKAAASTPPLLNAKATPPTPNYSGDADRATLIWRIQDAQANQRDLMGELARSGLNDDQKSALEDQYDAEVQRELLNQNLLENLP